MRPGRVLRQARAWAWARAWAEPPQAAMAMAWVPQATVLCQCLRAGATTASVAALRAFLRLRILSIRLVCHPPLLMLQRCQCRCPHPRPRLHRRHGRRLCLSQRTSSRSGWQWHHPAQRAALGLLRLLPPQAQPLPVSTHLRLAPGLAVAHSSNAHHHPGLQGSMAGSLSLSRPTTRSPSSEACCSCTGNGRGPGLRVQIRRMC